jgi:hypothetical protein
MGNRSARRIVPEADPVREELSALRTANERLEAEIKLANSRTWAGATAVEHARADIGRLADRVLRMEAVHMGVVDQLDPENAPSEAAKRFDRYVDFSHLRYSHNKTVKQLEEERARVAALEARNAETCAILEDHIEKDTPSAYLCPITHAIMEDPVLAADGFAYERKAITRHITSSSVVRSPNTREFMRSQLTPLPFLKRAIGEWKDAHRVPV